MAGQLVIVDFYGDKLDAIRDGDNIWVGLKRLCENFGIDPETQRRKLSARRKPVTGIMPVTAADGKTYQTTMIAYRAIPLWVASISPSKVKEELRDKLELYIEEVEDKLADLVLGGNTGEPSDPIGKALYHNGQALKHCWDKIVEVKQQVEDMQVRLASVEASNQLGQGQRPMLPAKVGDEPWYTIREWVIGQGIKLSTPDSAQAGMKMSGILRNANIETRKAYFGEATFNTYPESMLREHVGEAVAKPRTNALYRRESMEKRLDKVTAELVADPNRSDPVIATACDVSNGTVAKRRGVLEYRRIIPEAATRIGADGKVRRSKQDKETLFDNDPDPIGFRLPANFSPSFSLNGNHGQRPE